MLVVKVLPPRAALRHLPLLFLVYECAWEEQGQEVFEESGKGGGERTFS